MGKICSSYFHLYYIWNHCQNCPIRKRPKKSLTVTAFSFWYENDVDLCDDCSTLFSIFDWNIEQFFRMAYFDGWKPPRCENRKDVQQFLGVLCHFVLANKHTVIWYDLKSLEFRIFNETVIRIGITCKQITGVVLLIMLKYFEVVLNIFESSRV